MKKAVKIQKKTQKDIEELPGNKATVSNDVPVSVLKESISAYYEKLADIFNNCICSGAFPEITKIAEVAPVAQKLTPHQKQIIAQ